MTNLVKSLRKIHNEDICLLIVLEVSRQIINKLNQLCLAGSALSEIMLKGIQDVVLFSMFHYQADKHMCHDLTADAGEGVFSLVFLSLLEGWGDVSCTQIFRDLSCSKIMRSSGPMSSASSVSVLSALGPRLSGPGDLFGLRSFGNPMIQFSMMFI